ncbi:MAG: hypothetical protein J2P46_10560, partial [Zavarzinella sp.]|nr:hypothetical protein [Zavarzinella sp.]
MRTHIIALAAAAGLSAPAFAGELDGEFKGAGVNGQATALPASSKSPIEVVSGTELDKESPTQASRF